MNEEKRFLASILKDEATGCWIWQKSLNHRGYSRFRVGSQKDGTRKIVPGHRWAYEKYVCPIPKGLHIDHLCKNRPCVNPEHLEPVTNAENTRRACKGKRQERCKRGHELTPQNTRYGSDGWRRCRKCYKANVDGWYQRNKEQILTRKRNLFAAKKAAPSSEAR